MSNETEGPLEFADVRLRQLRGGMPTGLAKAKLARAGGLQCACGQASTRTIAGFAVCADATCGLVASTKGEYRRLKRA
jgi:hypothetical protein